MRVSHIKQINFDEAIMTFKTLLLSTIAISVTSAFAFVAFADTMKNKEMAAEDDKWDVMNPPGDKREIDLSLIHISEPTRPY